jgi:signal transduction histidine kinase/HAMP domain-containing protein
MSSFIERDPAIDLIQQAAAGKAGSGDDGPEPILEAADGRELSMKLATRLAIAFISLSVIPLAITGLLAYSDAKETVESQTFHNLQANNLLKNAEFERWLNDDLQQLGLLAQRPLVKVLTMELIGSDASAGGPEEIRGQRAYSDLLEIHLIPLANILGGFESISILQAQDGLVLVSTNPSLEGRSLVGERYFLEGKARPYMDEVAYTPAHAALALHMSTPVTDELGNTIAVLVGQSDLREMSSIIRQGNALDPTEDSYLVNGFHFFVTEPRFGMQSALGTRVQTEGVDACLAGNSGTGIYLDYRGVSVLGAYNWLPEHNLCILTEVDQAQAFAPIRSMGRTILGIGALVAVGTAALVIYFSRRLTRPLRQLERSVKSISQGNLDQKIEVTSSDEFGKLAATFNEMTTNLSASIEMVDYNRKMMRALNQAGTDLQRIREESAITSTIVHTIEELGYKAVLLRQSEDQQELRIAHISIEPNLLAAAERIAGVSVSNFRQPLQEESLITNIMRSGTPTFVSDMSETMAGSASGLGRGVMKRIFKLLDLAAGIYAPIKTEDITFGLLIVVGDGLSRHDVSAVATFANQVANALENAHLYRELADWTQELERRVAERTELLERSNQELEQFTYVASHDLQEPLRSVAGFLQLIERRSGAVLDEEGKEFIQRAVNAAQRMQTLIADLLHLSRVGTRAPDMQPVDSAKPLEAALRSLQHSIDASGVKIVVKHHLPTVLADESQLAQLFQNLIGNAIKFHREARPLVQISAESENGNWKFSVRDNGIGIDPEYFERIFQVFQRLHGRDAYEGTGIGLAIAKKIVERHGGRIWVESKPEKGATFYFTLPHNEDQS